jgi:hypothetical protein
VDSSLFTDWPATTLIRKVEDIDLVHYKNQVPEKCEKVAPLAFYHKIADRMRTLTPNEQQASRENISGYFQSGTFIKDAHDTVVSFLQY